MGTVLRRLGYNLGFKISFDFIKLLLLRGI
jgi:hypothetical protein